MAVVLAKSPMIALHRRSQSVGSVTKQSKASAATSKRATSVAALVLKPPPQAAPYQPAVVKINVSSAIEAKVSATVQGAQVEDHRGQLTSTLSAVCGAGSTSAATFVSLNPCRGSAAKGTLQIDDFEPVPFSLAHTEQGLTFVNSKGRWRHTALSAPPWDWKNHSSEKPTDGFAADLEVSASARANQPGLLKVALRPATEMELKRFLQLRALKEAEEDEDYDTLIAQLMKAKQAGVEREHIERGEERLKELRKAGRHVAEGCAKDDIRTQMVWSRITSRSGAPNTNTPCVKCEDCPCNNQQNEGEQLEVYSNAVQDFLSDFGPEGDRELFQELADSACAVEEGAVWRAGGKFIFSAFDRNQSVIALTRMLMNQGRSRCAKMILRLVQQSESRYEGHVTAIQINFHPHGKTFHDQHRDIYSAKQRAGPNCTCSFKKAVGTVCFTVGSSRVCLLDTCTDELSAIKQCGDSCQGRSERQWLHSGDAMYFNEAWNSNHTHGIPQMQEESGPRISIAFLLGADESRSTMHTGKN